MIVHSIICDRCAHSEKIKKSEIPFGWGDMLIRRKEYETGNMIVDGGFTHLCAQCRAALEMELKKSRPS